TLFRSGNYREWKEILAKEAKNQCVYCAIHEAAFGGTRNFHVEHYRPKSIFKKLTNNIKNLFYACAICNTFKGDDWPCEPHIAFSVACYPDASKTDYNQLFELDLTGEIKGKFVASKYMVEKLYLNRPQLLMERRTANARIRLDSVIERLTASTKAITGSAQVDQEGLKLLARAIKLLGESSKLQTNLAKIRPYKPQHIERTSKKKAKR
ncbi:MAG: HNH endonuclease, partial [Nitrosomonas ureae]